MNLNLRRFLSIFLSSMLFALYCIVPVSYAEEGEEEIYTLVVNHASNGTVSVDYKGGEIESETSENATYYSPFHKEDEVTVIATPNPGYNLTSLVYKYVDSDEQTVTVPIQTDSAGNGTFSFPSDKIEADVPFLTIEATFSRIYVPPTIYGVTTSTDGNGTVTASPSSGERGKIINLSVSPNPGYELKSLTVNDADVTASVIDGSYSFSLTKKTSVYASFEKLYNISVSDAEGGSVTADPASAVAGTAINVNVNINEDEGYKLKSLSYTYTTDEGQKTESIEIANGAGSFVLPEADVNIVPEFEKLYNISVSNAEGGSVTADPVSAVAGTDINVAVNENKGYKLKSLNYTYTTDEGQKTASIEIANGEGSFVLPEADVNIVPVFEKLYSISVSDAEGGTVTAIPESAVAGTDITLRVNENEGYKLKYLTYTYTYMTDEGQIIETTTIPVVYNNNDTYDVAFKLPEADVNIVPKFEKTEYDETPYDIDVSIQNDGGDILVNGELYDKPLYDKPSAYAYEKVRIDIIPDRGKKIFSLGYSYTVNNKFQYVPLRWESGEASFYMPAANVTVTASFVGTDVVVLEQDTEVKIADTIAIDNNQRKELIESLSKSSSPGLENIVNNALSDISDEEEEQLKKQGEALLKNYGLLEEGEQTILSLKPVLNMLVTDYSTDPNNPGLSMDISASYDVIAYGENVNPSDVNVKSDPAATGNAVEIKRNGMKALNVALELQINLLRDFGRILSDEYNTSQFYVQHEKDSGDVYNYKPDGAKLMNESILHFTSKHGLSPFIISPDNVQTFDVDDEGFNDLQKALDAVEDNGTLTVLRAYDGSSAEVKMEGDEKTFEIDIESGVTFDAKKLIKVDENKYRIRFSPQNAATGKITASIKKKTPDTAAYSITDNTSEDAHGSIEITPSTDIEEGEAVTITIKADSGYVLNRLILDGEEVAAEDITNNTYTFEMPSRDLTAKAEFKIKSRSSGSGGSGGGSIVTASFTLTFDTNGGSEIKSVSGASGTVIDLSAYKPTKDGSTFGGWYSDSGLKNSVTSVTLTSNTKVYAKWTENSSNNNNNNNNSNSNNNNNNSNNSNTAFTDVPGDAYYAPAVAWAVEKGVTTGTSSAAFSPDNDCTRAEMVSFLWRAAGSPEPTSADNPFKDVGTGSYYSKAVLWAVSEGITTGTSADTFSPDETVDRGQTVTFIYRAAGKPEASGEIMFTDVNAGMFYFDAVKWAAANNVTNGISETEFGPDLNCTRAQIVTLLYRHSGARLSHY